MQDTDLVTIVGGSIVQLLADQNNGARNRDTIGSFQCCDGRLQNRLFIKYNGDHPSLDPLDHSEVVSATLIVNAFNPIGGTPASAGTDWIAAELN